MTEMDAFLLLEQYDMVDGRVIRRVSVKRDGRIKPDDGEQIQVCSYDLPSHSPQVKDPKALALCLRKSANDCTFGWPAGGLIARWRVSDPGIGYASNVHW